MNAHRVLFLLLLLAAVSMAGVLSIAVHEVFQKLPCMEAVCEPKP